MNISRFTVHRPVFTTMVTLVVVLLGLVALLRLPVDLMPDISYPTLSVSTSYENASPEEIEELITKPIEEALSAVPGVEEVASTSVEGASSITVKFSWGTDLDAAANDVRDRLDRVIPRLPDDADRPVLRKFDLASFPILILGASSELDPVQMRELIEDQVKYRIERVPGVAAMDIWGGLSREIHVNIHADRIKALGLSLEEIMQRLRAGNVNVPAGSLDRGSFGVMVRTQGTFTSIDQIRRTVIGSPDGVPVELGSVADVEDSWEKVSRIVRVNGRSGIRLSVNKQSGKNTVEVARGVLAEIEAINRDLPQLRLVPIIDSSDYIQRSISNVGSSAVYGGSLAVLVLLVFLRSLRSTAVIATAIPVSIIATFALMYFGNFTLNIMTLGGLALGIGMLLDNSIVVLENIHRLHESGRKPTEAAVDGAGEVTSAIISSTLTTLAVFLPLVFVRGMSGVMFKELSFVVSFSLLCSLGVALTLVPMLAAKLLRREEQKEIRDTLGHRLYMLTGAAFAAVESSYKDILHWALSHRPTVIVASLAVLGGSLALYPLIGSELMPATDESEIRISAEMAVGTRVEVVSEHMRAVERIVEQTIRPEEIKSMVVSAGGNPWQSGGSHVCEMRIGLVPISQRTRSSEQIAVELRKRLGKLPGMAIRTRAGQGMVGRMMGGSGGNSVQIDIRGHDLRIADELAARVRTIVEGVPGVTDTQLSRESGTPEEFIHIDRDKAADLGVSVEQIADMLQTALGGTTAGYFREGGDEYAILVKLKDAERHTIRDILDLTLLNRNGESVVLSNVVSSEPQTGPVKIERKDQERLVTVSANISGRDLGSVLADVQERLRSVPRPQGFAIVFSGDYEDQVEAERELLLSFVLALVLVYMVMACQFESLRDPFVVMFSVPLAAVGVLLILFLTKTTFNIQSYIGCIMLGGIVVNNAIILVDHINLLRRRDGMALRDAIEEAGRRRLRPIMMTALTTVFGLVPMALGLGESGEAQAPLARAVIGGLASSTLITLLVVPVVYSIFERKKPQTEVVE
jgi:HAE1 family hydrophobic/amphiphilic exporter-1